MPAERRLFASSDPPSVIVVDSSFLFEALIDPQSGDGRHEACLEFATAMQRSGTTLLTSPLVYVEAPQCWRRLYARGVLVPLSGAYDARERERAFVDATARLRSFLRAFEAREVPFTRRLSDAATRLAGRYNLRAHDALIAALSVTSQVRHLVGLDRDFHRVDGITVWHP